MTLLKSIIGVMRHSRDHVQVYECLLYGLCLHSGARGAFLTFDFRYVDMAIGSLRDFDPVEQGLNGMEPGKVIRKDSLYLYSSRLAEWSVGLDGGDGPDPAFVESLISTATSLCSVMSLRPDRVKRDRLTGLPDREAMFMDLRKAVSGAEKNSIPLHFLYIDLNNFKSVNDTFGHAMGDRVLSRVAHDLDRMSSGYGRVYRAGGDEFCVVLAGVEFQKAYRIVERIEGCKWHVGGITVTCSVGMSGWSDGMKAEDVIEAADRRMYEVKQSQKQLDLRMMGTHNTDHPLR